MTARPTRRGDRVSSLLGRTARGETGAFEQLYDEMSGNVLGLAVRMLRNRGIAEEVSQDVWADVWRTSKRFVPNRGSGRAWIMTLAHRRAVDRVREAQAGEDRDHAYGARRFVRPFDQVAETVDAHARHDQVRLRLHVLTEPQRSTLYLTYYGGCTYAEVAQTLGVPPGTVKTRIRDVMIRLREALVDGDLNV